MRRQCPFNFISLGDFLVAYLAYMFGSKFFHPDGDLATSVAGLVWPEFASDPEGTGFFFRGVTNYVAVCVVQVPNYC